MPAPLAFQKNVAHTAVDGGIQIPGPGDHRGRHPLYKGPDRDAPGREPPHTVQEAMRGLAMETTQRRLMRYGVPRIVANAAPCRPNRVVGGEVPATQPAGATRTAGAGADRPDTAGKPSRADSAPGICSGAAHSRGAAVQQPNGTIPLLAV